ncbi:type I-B CRISPR-associated protein Cas8b1/Cst1 [Clostridium peptidivorans]|uniref:type I-B CRISPR-associated protein Cas8b1/Cst1 n=1 Tax=Clostridium peptidivorans TaxID=100174 RepID=UPI000BE40E42|nr:type I-B CRISPR-associated protein Cas8b1/Cst1 [Clostridium peptidivorans]
MRKITTIKLELSDWLYNAGIVGIANIFDANDVEYTKGLNYIEFEDSALDDFEEKYFKYFIKKYEKFTSWYKLISFQDYIEGFNINTIAEKDIEKINKYIKDIKKKLTSNSYKSGYLLIKDNKLDLLKEEKKLKKIKLTKKQKAKDAANSIQEQFQIIKAIIQYLKKDEVKKVILSKNIIYEVIQKFWSEVSFLNKNCSTKNMYEEYKSYFLDSAINYINEDKNKFKYSCFTCNGKVSNLEKTKAYTLTWINQIGVDMKRKTSHFWNFNADSFICPICNLVYSCIPAGFTVISGKGLFINENSNIESLIKINRHSLDHNSSFEDLEQETYYNIVENMSQSSVEHFQKEIENIQIVKLDSNNDRRPYTFNILSKDKLRVVSENKNRLKSMIKIHAKVGNKEYLNLYREVLARLYDGKNQFDLINKLLYLKLDEKFNRIQFIDMILKINNSFFEGSDKGKMVSYKTIDECRKAGLLLRNEYINKNAKNKLGGISYRLLNALKTKNTARFMDTLLNSYMYLGKQVPMAFVDALKDVDRFQSIGYSFVLGLQGEKINNDKEEEKGEVK